MNGDKIKGSVLALAMGDALGAEFEGGVFEKAVWKVLGTSNKKCRWTDDTQMSIDIIESLIACGEVNQDDMAKRFADSYEWSRGYGPGAARILKLIKAGVSWREANRQVFKDGSFGNGAAMRAGPIGLYFANRSEENIVTAARRTAEITHAHPLGMEGAVIIALATAKAATDASNGEIVGVLMDTVKEPPFQQKVSLAETWLNEDSAIDVLKTRSMLGNGIAAQDSVVTAIYTAMSHRERPFEELLLYVRNLGGDVDTIGAMAGAIWGAARGAEALPDTLIHQVEQHEYLDDLSRRFVAVCLS